MSDDSKGHQPQDSERSSSVLNTTVTELVEYLNRKSPGKLCLYCGQAEYAVPANPQGTHAAVITAPVPKVQGLGAWFFMLVCPSCGHSTLFNAHMVVGAMARGE